MWSTQGRRQTTLDALNAFMDRAERGGWVAELHSPEIDIHDVHQRFVKSNPGLPKSALSADAEQTTLDFVLRLLNTLLRNGYTERIATVRFADSLKQDICTMLDIIKVCAAGVITLEEGDVLLMHLYEMNNRHGEVVYMYLNMAMFLAPVVMDALPGPWNELPHTYALVVSDIGTMQEQQPIMRLFFGMLGCMLNEKLASPMARCADVKPYCDFYRVTKSMQHLVRVLVPSERNLLQQLQQPQQSQQPQQPQQLQQPQQPQQPQQRNFKHLSAFMERAERENWLQCLASDVLHVRASVNHRLREFDIPDTTLTQAEIDTSFDFFVRVLNALLVGYRFDPTNPGVEEVRDKMTFNICAIVRVTSLCGFGLLSTDEADVFLVGMRGDNVDSYGDMGRYMDIALFMLPIVLNACSEAWHGLPKVYAAIALCVSKEQTLSGANVVRKAYCSMFASMMDTKLSSASVPCEASEAYADFMLVTSSGPAPSTPAQSSPTCADGREPSGKAGLVVRDVLASPAQPPPSGIGVSAVAVECSPTRSVQAPSTEEAFLRGMAALPKFMLFVDQVARGRRSTDGDKDDELVELQLGADDSNLLACYERLHGDVQIASRQQNNVYIVRCNEFLQHASRVIAFYRGVAEAYCARQCACVAPLSCEST